MSTINTTQLSDRSQEKQPISFAEYNDQPIRFVGCKYYLNCNATTDKFKVLASDLNHNRGTRTPICNLQYCIQEWCHKTGDELANSLLGKGKSEYSSYTLAYAKECLIQFRQQIETLQALEKEVAAVLDQASKEMATYAQITNAKDASALLEVFN